MVLHYSVSGAEAQARPFSDWLGGIERIEYTFGVAESRPCVGKLDNNFTSFVP